MHLPLICLPVEWRIPVFPVLLLLSRLLKFIRYTKNKVNLATGASAEDQMQFLLSAVFVGVSCYRWSYNDHGHLHPVSPRQKLASTGSQKLCLFPLWFPSVLRM